MRSRISSGVKWRLDTGSRTILLEQPLEFGTADESFTGLSGAQDRNPGRGRIEVNFAAALVCNPHPEIEARLVGSSAQDQEIQHLNVQRVGVIPEFLTCSQGLEKRVGGLVH